MKWGRKMKRQDWGTLDVQCEWLLSPTAYALTSVSTVCSKGWACVHWEYAQYSPSLLMPL